MAAMASFNTEKWCHLVSVLAASAQHINSSIHIRTCATNFFSTASRCLLAAS